MNARERILSMAFDPIPPSVTPAAFFMHFGPGRAEGQAAVDAHLEFFRATGMDLAKVQYEQQLPPGAPIVDPRGWADAPRVDAAFFEPTVRVVQGVVRALRREAVVVVTLYSPFMWAKRLTTDELLAEHLRSAPEQVARGLEIMVENVLTLARACMRAGADGFYASTQGGEAFRSPDSSLFERYIKPSDLAVWEAIRGCSLNILHICDYVGGYRDLAPFRDYPGHIVNCSLHVGGRAMAPREAGELFGRPFMGGMERLGALAGGDLAAIRRAAEQALADAPERFILGADCTVPSETPWEHLRAAVEVAHAHMR